MHLLTTLIFPINEGGLSTVYSACGKLVPPNDLGRIVHLGTIHHKLFIAMLFTESSSIVYHGTIH